MYIPAVTAAGALALVAGSMSIDADRVDLTMFLFLSVLAGVSQRLPVFLFRNSAISVSFAATTAAYVLFGTGFALWINLAAAAVNAFTPQRKPLEKAMFNASALTISAYAAGVVYTAVGGRSAPTDVLPTVLAVVLSGSVYFLVNSVLVTTVISLTTRDPFAVIYKENYSWMAVNWIAASVNGAALALAYQAISIFGALAFVMPLAVAWYSFKLFMLKSRESRRRNEELHTLNGVLLETNLKLQESQVSIVAALVGALEAKDEGTHGYAAATMVHAVATGRKLGLSEEEIATVQLAALFHDIGKIGVAEQILRKPGPLGYTEWTAVKDHSRIGANMLSRIPTLALVRPAVLAHHERWDGTGYPDRLAGEDIPLAARIVAACDAYQAMISPRPYRTTRTQEQAIEELVRHSGTQFDPRIVEAFVAALREEPSPATEPERAAAPRTRAIDAAAW
jgi:hypothetical protein